MAIASPKYLQFVALFVVLVSASMAQNPVPVIYQPLSPASVAPGHAAFTLEVRGTGFQSGAVVKWNGHLLKTKVISGSRLQAVVPAAAVGKASTGTIAVSNPGTIASNVIYLPVRAPSATVNFAVDPAAIEGGEVVVGDFNNDGKADISVAPPDGENESISADTYLSLGNGSFNKVQGGDAFSGLINIPGDIAADFNNDGNLDVAVCSSTGGPNQSCSIFLGDGKGGLAAPTASTGYAGVGVAADMNGDGILDAVTTYWDGYGTYLYFQPGLGDGTFGFVGPNFITLNFYFGGLPVVGDFNGDGKLDVAVPGGGIVAVLLGNGDGTFQKEVDYPISNEGFPTSVVADINHDGKLDILTTVAGSVAILLGKGDGTFVNGVSATLPNGRNLQIADLNGDGELDLATLTTTNVGPQTLNIALGNGDGTFQAPLAFAAGSNVSASGLISIADFNNDGHLDFAISGSMNAAIPSPSLVLLQTPAN